MKGIKTQKLLVVIEGHKNTKAVVGDLETDLTEIQVGNTKHSDSEVLLDKHQ